MDILCWANYVLSSDSNQPITHLKLQKLLYYLQVWGLVAEIPLIEEPFEKWRHGPVNSTVFQTYTKNGSQPLQGELCAGPPSEKKKLADFILDAYLPLTPYELSDRSHKEEPWQITAANAPISKENIIQYYRQDPFAKNFIPTFDPENRPFHLLRDNNWYAYTMDMSNEDAERHGVFPSYAIYKATI